MGREITNVGSRVLLVNPPTAASSQPVYLLMPLGLLSIASYLRGLGHETQLVDANVAIGKLGRRTDAAVMEWIGRAIRDFQPTVVGVTVMGVGQLATALAVTAVAKDIAPTVVTVWGGAHASQFAVQLLAHCPALDFVALGEGERQAAWIARTAASDETPAAMPDGIAYREGGEVRVNSKRSFVRSLDSLPIPAYDLVRVDDYANDIAGWHNPLGLDLRARAPVMTSRGCPHGCNFCAIATHMGERFRPMSAMAVVDMLQLLSEEHGVRVAAVHDAVFTQSTARVLAICTEILKRRLAIALDIYTGVPVSVTPPEVVHALAEVGLVRLGLSIESGDPYIRNAVMGKRFKDAQVFALIDACRRHPEVYLGVDLVLGMPEDTEESLERTLALVTAIDVDEVAMTVATPFPGTRLYAQCLRDRLFRDDLDLDELWRAKDYAWGDAARFVIKPYTLGDDQLRRYYDAFQQVRIDKFAHYRYRMQRLYGIDSPYGVSHDAAWAPFGRRA